MKYGQKTFIAKGYYIIYFSKTYFEFIDFFLSAPSCRDVAILALATRVSMLSSCQQCRVSLCAQPLETRTFTGYFVCTGFVVDATFIRGGRS